MYKALILVMLMLVLLIVNIRSLRKLSNEERFNEILPSDFITDDKFVDVDETELQDYSELFDRFLRKMELTESRWNILTHSERSNIYDMVRYKDMLYNRLDSLTSAEESLEECEDFDAYCQRNPDNTLKALPIGRYQAYTLEEFTTKLDKCFMIKCGRWNKASLLVELSFLYNTFFEIMRRNEIMYTIDDATIQFNYDAFKITNSEYTSAREELELFLNMCRLKLRKFHLEDQKKETMKQEIRYNFKINNSLI